MNYISLHANYHKHPQYPPLIYETHFKISNNKDDKYKCFNFEFETYENLKNKRINILKSHGTNIQTKENTFIVFDCALPCDETINVLNDKDGYLKLEIGLKTLMLNIEKKCGLTPIFYSFHSNDGFKGFDNKTYLNHFNASLCFYNYNFNIQKSVLRTLKRNIWSKLQDLAETTFQSCGINYKRGTKKTPLIKDKELYVNECITKIFESSIDSNNNLNIESLKENIKKELLQALKYEFQEKFNKEKLLKFDNMDKQLKKIQKITFELIENK